MNKLYVYMFRSRNKDNRNLEGFKERRKMLLEYEKNESRVLEKYQSFINEGLPGERVRLYRSVNSRDEAKIRKALIIKLIAEEPSVTKLNASLASVAQHIENRAESKWMFDFDVDSAVDVSMFIKDISTHSGIDDLLIETHKTPNGYAVIVPHGFDTRELLNDWKDYDITLKRDDLLFLDIREKIGGLTDEED